MTNRFHLDSIFLLITRFHSVFFLLPFNSSKKMKKNFSIAAKLSSFSAHHLPTISSHAQFFARSSAHHCWHTFLSRLLMALDVGDLLCRMGRRRNKTRGKRKWKPHQWQTKQERRYGRENSIETRREVISCLKNAAQCFWINYLKPTATNREILPER